jgi:hypothetical protein
LRTQFGSVGLHESRWVWFPWSLPQQFALSPYQISIQRGISISQMNFLLIGYMLLSLDGYSRVHLPIEWNRPSTWFIDLGLKFFTAGSPPPSLVKMPPPSFSQICDGLVVAQLQGGFVSLAAMGCCGRCRAVLQPGGGLRSVVTGAGYGWCL